MVFFFVNVIWFFLNISVGTVTDVCSLGNETIRICSSSQFSYWVSMDRRVTISLEIVPGTGS